METSLKTDFAQIFSRCPKNLSCPKFGGAAAPLAPPGPYAYEQEKIRRKRGSGREFALIPYPTPPHCFSCSYLFASSLQMNKIITVEDAF